MKMAEENHSILEKFPPSLLKYDPPELLMKKAESVSSESSEDKELSIDGVPISHLLTLQVKKAKEILKKFLNETFPPRTYDDNGDIWIQYVSKDPTDTPMDAVGLQNDLDALTVQRQARETGVCPIRRELYDQCFDELIRRIMIDDLDQGYLLARVRDELRKTLGVYEDILHIGEAFGIRKALRTKQIVVDKNAELQIAQKEKEELANQLVKMVLRHDTIERKAVEERPVYKKKYAEEVRYAKKLNQQLKEQLTKYMAQDSEKDTSSSES